MSKKYPLSLIIACNIINIPLLFKLTYIYLYNGTVESTLFKASFPYFIITILNLLSLLIYQNLKKEKYNIYTLPLMLFSFLYVLNFYLSGFIAENTICKGQSYGWFPCLSETLIISSIISIFLVIFTIKIFKKIIKTNKNINTNTNQINSSPIEIEKNIKSEKIILNDKKDILNQFTLKYILFFILLNLTLPLVGMIVLIPIMFFLPSVSYVILYSIPNIVSVFLTIKTFFAKNNLNQDLSEEIFKRFFLSNFLIIFIFNFLLLIQDYLYKVSNSDYTSNTINSTTIINIFILFSNSLTLIILKSRIIKTIKQNIKKEEIHDHSL